MLRDYMNSPPELKPSADELRSRAKSNEPLKVATTRSPMVHLTSKSHCPVAFDWPQCVPRFSSSFRRYRTSSSDKAQRTFGSRASVPSLTGPATPLSAVTGRHRPRIVTEGCLRSSPSAMARASICG